MYIEYEKVLSVGYKTGKCWGYFKLSADDLLFLIPTLCAAVTKNVGKFLVDQTSYNLSVRNVGTGCGGGLQN